MKSGAGCSAPRVGCGLAGVVARVGAACLFVIFLSDVVLACPICFRVEESATTDGVMAAVWVLVGVTVAVLGAFGRFVVRFARRERAQLDETAKTTAARLAEGSPTC